MAFGPRHPVRSWSQRSQVGASGTIRTRTRSASCWLIVRVAWSDTAFYVDPRQEGLTARTQLLGWQRGVAEGRTVLGATEGDTES